MLEKRPRVKLQTCIMFSLFKPVVFLTGEYFIMAFFEHIITTQFLKENKMSVAVIKSTVFSIQLSLDIRLAPYITTFKRC